MHQPAMHVRGSSQASPGAENPTPPLGSCRERTPTFTLTTPPLSCALLSCQRRIARTRLFTLPVFCLCFVYNFYWHIAVYNVVLASDVQQVVHLYTYIYSSFLRLFTHRDYYRVLSGVPCALQQVLIITDVSFQCCLFLLL